jgi:hypothetical protein
VFIYQTPETVSLHRLVAMMKTTIRAFCFSHGTSMAAQGGSGRDADGAEFFR